MRFVILGNSGSGKSTLARWLAEAYDLPSLDLDTVAWEPRQVAVPRPEEEASAEVRAFCAAHEAFVIEGCYGGLVEAAAGPDTTLVWLDPGVDVCLAHCRSRPWEPHKYVSGAAQDEQLEMLLDWVRAYETREDDLSRAGHAQVFARWQGPRLHRTAPADAALVVSMAAGA